MGLSNVFSTKDFHYSSDDRTFVAEVSQLPGFSFRDAPLALVSHKTQVMKTFAYDRVDMNGGDVAGVWYRDEVSGLRVLVIND